MMCKTLFATLIAIAAVSGCKSSDRADNTARNTRDRTVTPTADNAVHSSSDRDLTQQIRKSLMADDSLSTNAHNCKIVVQDGAVTLVGPVANDDERAKVQQLAAAIAGDHNVTNQLEVTH